MKASCREYHLLTNGNEFFFLRGGNAAFSATLPVLEHLLLVMLGRNGHDVWEHIFPFNLIPVGETIPQIKSLLISLINECDAAFICSLFTLFPNLARLRHFITKNIEGRECLCLCEHDAKIGKFISSKTINLGFKEYYDVGLFCWLYGLRQHMNLRRKDFCFWGETCKHQKVSAVEDNVKYINILSPLL